jgi:Domain of unknown function (DUF4864)
LRSFLFWLFALVPASVAATTITGADVAEIRAVIEQQVDTCAVQRPVQLSFLDLVVMGPDVVQQVRVTDRGGAVWVAYYAMERQKDGTWRTHGCHLVQPVRTISA